MEKRRKGIRFLTLSAILSAFLAVMSPWTIPVGAIPVTLSTFALFLIAAVFSPSVSTTATGVYLAVGAMGLPVFAGFHGGVGMLIGPTGGYLWAYLPAVLIVSLAARRDNGIRRRLPLYMIGATALIYLLGTVWFALVSDCGVGEAVIAAVLPFVLPDLVKIAAATAVALMIRKRFARLLS